MMRLTVNKNYKLQLKLVLKKPNTIKMIYIIDIDKNNESTAGGPKFLWWVMINMTKVRYDESVSSIINATSSNIK